MNQYVHPEIEVTESLSAFIQKIVDEAKEGSVKVFVNASPSAHSPGIAAFKCILRSGECQNLYAIWAYLKQPFEWNDVNSQLGPQIREQMQED